jgi:hypothetical protein
LKSQHQYPQLRSTQIDNFHNIIQGFVLCLYNLQGFFATIVHPLQPPSLFLKVGISLMKEGSLFFCFDFHYEISQTTMPLAALLVQLESPQWVWVHGVGFIMFQPKVEKLLNIEYFFIDNSFKSKLKTIGEFGHTFGIFWKPSVSRI